MIALLCVLVSRVLTVTPSVRAAQPLGNKGNAEITGIVKDVDRASVAGSIVEFTSKKHHFAVAVGTDGAYAVHLTPGTYSVTARKPGFCDGHRAPFSIAANQKIEFDFVLLVNVQASDGGQPRDPGYYKEETLMNLGAKALPPLVQFGAREAKDGSIFYSSVTRHTLSHPHGTYVDERYPAIFTDDSLTLSANSLTFNPHKKSITGIGSVILQNGTAKKRGSKITVSFLNGRAVVTGVS